MPAADGTLITAPANTKAKIRFRETYTSEGLNKKLNGVAPHGVLRGFRLGTSGVALTVDLELDASTLDSIISYVDANGYQLTYRETAVVPLDLTAAAGTAVFIAVYIDYTVSGVTVVQWRAYTTTQLALETETVLIVGRVMVPISGVITADKILSTKREVAWKQTARGMREWYQWIENGGFEVGFGGTGIVVPGSTDENWLPGWDIVSATGTNLTWRIEYLAPAPRTGANELRITVSLGGGVTNGSLYYGGRKSVIPGQLIHLSLFVRGDSAPLANTNGGVGFIVGWYDSDLQMISSEKHLEILSGTFSYQELESIAEVPAGAAFVKIGLVYDSQGANAAGDFYIDDVRAWFEVGAELDDSTRRDIGYEQSARIRELDIAPHKNDYIDMVEFVSKALLIRQEPEVSGVLQPVMQARDEGTTPFDLLIRNGSLDIENVIKELGANFIGTKKDLEIPRILSPMGAAATNSMTLLWECTNPVGTEGNVRIYAGTGAIAGGAPGNVAILFVINASWDDSMMVWYRDSADDSYLWCVSDAGLNTALRLAADADGWSWNLAANQGRITTTGFRDTSGAPNVAMAMELAGAYFQFYNPTVNDRDWHSTTSSTYLRNALSSRNIINSWCRVVGNAPGTGYRYGLTSSLVTGPPDDMRFTFDHVYGSNLRYGVLAQVFKNSATPSSYFCNVFNPAAGAFDVRVYDDTGAHINVNSGVIGLMVGVVGAYASSP